MLRKLLALSLAVAMLAFTTGCPTKDKKTKTEGPAGNGTEKAQLELSPPKDVTIKQGGEAKVTVEVTRKNFKDDLTVKFAQLPKGVSAEADAVIPGDKVQATFTLKADEKADPVSKHKAKVTIADKAGKLTTDNSFQITVEQKK
jgi:hypothetical protein